MKLGANGIECAADQLTLELLPNDSVAITIACPSRMEAGVLFEDISEQARSGTLRLYFKIATLRDETP